MSFVADQYQLVVHAIVESAKAFLSRVSTIFGSCSIPGCVADVERSVWEEFIARVLQWRVGAS